jgi:hypothetical protein
MSGTEVERMEKIPLVVFLVAMILVIGRVSGALLRVLGEGVQRSEELLRYGVTFGALWKGKVPNRGGGALVPAREGLLMEASPDGLKVEGTRTIARDVF